MLPQETIRKKRDKQVLTEKDIEDFVQGIDDWSITDGQIAALLMAALVNGLNRDELIAFVNAIVDTGIILDWDSVDLNGPVASVYAMAGVGDKTEIIAAPLLAACGVYVPMICERMQYHAGGTLDKLDSINGFVSRPSLARFRKTLRESGCAVQEGRNRRCGDPCRPRRLSAGPVRHGQYEPSDGRIRRQPGKPASFCLRDHQEHQGCLRAGLSGLRALQRRQQDPQFQRRRASRRKLCGIRAVHGGEPLRRPAFGGCRG